MCHTRLAFAIVATLQLISAGASLAAVSTPGAAVTPDSVPAAGRHETLVSVNAFGRWAVTVASRQGVGLQLVDRMAGPGEVRGTAGEQDGRIDAFLDRGEYRVITFGHEKASGSAKLELHAFAELSGSRPSLLVEHKPVSASLGDFQQISWWLHIPERRQVLIEVAGRHLAELKLWQDGTWAVDTTAACEVVEPVKGKPLNACRVWPTLEAGVYLLSAYGGAGEPWAAGGEERPLVLRYGVPRLPEAGRRSFAVSAFGSDRYLLPGSATFFRLELPEARPAELSVADLDASEPFGRAGQTAVIDKRSAPPLGEVRLGMSDRERVLTVTGEAGQPYVLQHFRATSSYPFEGSGDHFVASMHSGSPVDSIDATGLVTRYCTDRPTERTPYVDEVIELPGEAGFARRFNLLDTATLFVHLASPERLKVVTSGNAVARFRFEPFLLSRPEHYEAPPFKAAGESFDLDAGFFVLTIEPERKGILELAVRSQGVIDQARDALGLEGKVSSTPAVPSVRFPALLLEAPCRYTLLVNQQPGVTVGAVVRPLPLDLAAEPLPLALRPGEGVEVRITTAEAGALRAEAEDGSFMEVALDGGPPGIKVPVLPGGHVVRVRNAGARTLWSTLRVLPHRLAEEAPLPELPDALLAGIPAFPELGAGRPSYLDLERGQAATFKVRADRPALYRLETSGLLATAGTLRTRVVTRLDREESNGVGRNFLIQQYLREGDYQLTVSPTGLSRGHVGVHLTETPSDDGGELVEGAPARITLPAGHGVLYHFEIPTAGTYSLRALGANRTFRCRLEDGEGWPIEPPNSEASFTRRFEPGRYRLMLLPEAVETRRVTLLRRLPEPPVRSGHGPHPLALDQVVEHVWLEPAQGQDRTPDRWLLTMPAPAAVRIELGGEMEGVVWPAEGPRESPLAVVRPGRAWDGSLPAGSLVLEVVCSRRNNRAPYQVAVRPVELLPGMSREVAVPADLPVAVGRAGLVELSSFGSEDVRAELVDSRGAVLAASDDRPDDWGFLVATQLAPGRYTLRVTPVGADSATCAVAMRMPDEVVEPELTVPGVRELRTGTDAHVWPLPRGLSGVLMIAAHSEESVGLALEAAEGSRWRMVGAETGRAPHLEVPLPEDGSGAGRALRVRLWSGDGRGLTATLKIRAVTPREVTEQELARGVGLDPGETVQALRIRLDRAGVLRLDALSGARWSGTAGAACQAVDGGLVSAGGTTAWLAIARGTPAEQVRVAAVRVALGDGDQTIGLDESETAAFDLVGQGQRVVLVTATTLGGRPGVAVEVDGETPAAGAVPVLAVAPSAAAAVRVVNGGARARVWHADPGSGPLAVRVRQTSFTVPGPGEMARGVVVGVAPGNRAVAFALPDGAKRIRLALAANVAAALSRQGRIESVHWGGGTALGEEVGTQADQLLVLATASDGPFQLEVLPATAAPTEITPASPLERLDCQGRTFAADVRGRPGWWLHVRGAREATLLDENGQITTGLDQPCHGLGRVTLVAGDGPVVSWLDEPGHAGAALWTGAEGGERGLSTPAAVPLRGTTAAFRIAAEDPAVVSIRAATPAVSRLSRPDGSTEIEVHPDGVRLDVIAPAGGLSLGLRGLGGRELSGDLEVTTTRVEPTGEGLGTPVMLSPGGARGFSFVLPDERLVGLGVHGSGAGVEATVCDATGRALASGVVLMRRLPAGQYVLLLRSLTERRPVVARPAVAGLELPGSGPPQEVIQRYLALARGEADDEPEAAAPGSRAQGRHPVDESDEDGGFAEAEDGDGEVPEDGGE